MGSHEHWDIGSGVDGMYAHNGPGDKRKMTKIVLEASVLIDSVGIKRNKAFPTILLYGLFS